MKKPPRPNPKIAQTCKFRFVPGESEMARFCTHLIEFPPGRYVEITRNPETARWAREAGLRGMAVRYHRPTPDGRHMWGIKFSRAETALVFKMRWY